MAAVNMHFSKGLVVALLFRAFEIPSTCLIYIKHLYAYAYDVPMEIFMQITNDTIWYEPHNKPIQTITIQADKEPMQWVL